MKTVLMVAEKPSLAQSLSKILARGGQITTRKGFNGACSVHEFITRFPPTAETMRFKFTSVCGHVMSLDFLGKYNNWDKVDPVSWVFYLIITVVLAISRNSLLKGLIFFCYFKMKK